MVPRQVAGRGLATRRKRRRDFVALLIQPELSLRFGAMDSLIIDYYREIVGFNGAWRGIDTIEKSETVSR